MQVPVPPLPRIEHTGLATRSTSQLWCMAWVLHAQVPRALRERAGKGEVQECRVGTWRRPKKAFLFCIQSHSPFIECAYLVPDTVLGSGDSGMAQMQGRERGRGSY